MMRKERTTMVARPDYEKCLSVFIIKIYWQKFYMIKFSIDVPSSRYRYIDPSEEF